MMMKLVVVVVVVVAILQLIVLTSFVSLSSFNLKSVDCLQESSFNLKQTNSSIMLANVVVVRQKRTTNVMTKESTSVTTNRKLLPEFSTPIGNVTAVAGRDVRLVCTVDNLGSYQVAWLKEETKTILSIDTNIIITNYRIFLIPDEEGRKWVLHIKDVRESDRGFYQCQVNTNPTRSTSGYLEVVVAPTFIESETSQVAEVIEHSNVSFQCKANGHPKPIIRWHRNDNIPIQLVGTRRQQNQLATLNEASGGDTIQTSDKITKQQQQQLIPHTLTDHRGERLSLVHVDRSMAGVYVCTAFNGIPSQVSRQIPLFVKFAPNVSIGQHVIEVHLGESLDIDCLIEAYPKPTNYWSERQFVGTIKRKSLVTRPQIDNSRLKRLTNSKRQIVVIDNGVPQDNNNDDDDEHLVSSSSSDTGEQEAEPVDTNQETINKLVTTNESPKHQVSDGQATSAYVSVKQTVINSYTYKLRISIEKMRAEDYGEYICVSSNSLGNANARVFVKRAMGSKRRGEGQQVERPISLMNRSGEQTSNKLQPPQDHDVSSQIVSNQQYELNKSRASYSLSNQLMKQPNRVYDENYLQAIRTRQTATSGLVSNMTSKLQQKLRLYSTIGEHNSAKRQSPLFWFLIGLTYHSLVVSLYLSTR